ncbi:hypothetical protein EJ03DRAFT_351917 [Teratosphaeria nubilosa]|uniref:Uncharacterized protein n=1 Tax=Teratosphaeria nubilosa TaxID=161662 RepID=A0A6G1L781_9PEZI|nr:hypothetical protein EJ03DRAFT_351917 [Teratosphaeria nubilosa]
MPSPSQLHHRNPTNNHILNHLHETRIRVQTLERELKDLRRAIELHMPHYTPSSPVLSSLDQTAVRYPQRQGHASFSMSLRLWGGGGGDDDDDDDGGLVVQRRGSAESECDSERGSYSDLDGTSVGGDCSGGMNSGDDDDGDDDGHKSDEEVVTQTPSTGSFPTDRRSGASARHARADRMPSETSTGRPARGRGRATGGGGEEERRAAEKEEGRKLTGDEMDVVIMQRLRGRI